MNKKKNPNKSHPSTYHNLTWHHRNCFQPSPSVFIFMTAFPNQCVSHIYITIFHHWFKPLQLENCLGHPEVLGEYFFARPKSPKFQTIIPKLKLSFTDFTSSFHISWPTRTVPTSAHLLHFNKSKNFKSFRFSFCTQIQFRQKLYCWKFAWWTSTHLPLSFKVLGLNLGPRLPWVECLPIFSPCFCVYLSGTMDRKYTNMNRCLPCMLTKCNITQTCSHKIHLSIYTHIGYNTHSYRMCWHKI